MRKYIPAPHTRIFFYCALMVIAFFVGGGISLFVSTHRSSDLHAALADVSLSVSPVATTTPAFDIEILYTPTGFAPSFLDVPIGSRVAFKNTTNGPMLIASDPNPTRTDYPEFVAPRDYAPGETYIFQFEKGGTFGYDNDDKTTDHAFIHVVDPSNPGYAVDNVPPAQRAARDKFVSMLVPGNVNSIFTVFDAIQADPSISSNCHEMGHDIGNRAYELFGFSGAMTFTNPDRTNHAAAVDICSGGYMHGVIEELFSYQPGLANTPGVMCANVPMNNLASCYHGVGHGLMLVNKRDVSESLAGCRTLPTPGDAERCFEGVWMEFFWGDVDAGSLGWNPDAPLAPCISAQSDAQPACFLYASFGYLRENPEDYTGAINLCVNSGLTETQDEFCLQGVGITMLSHFGGQHLERSEQYAAGLAPAEKQAFYTGVIGYAAFSNVSTSTLTATCDLLVTDKDVCLGVVAKQ